MASQLDDVIISRAVSNRNRRGSGRGESSRSKSKQQELPTEKGNKSNQVLITSIVLFLFAVLVLIALVSYSARDEANAELSLKDIIGVLRGDDAIRAKVDTTYNWLGLLGAVLANYLYNYTFGYVAIVIPLMLGYWAKDLYRHYMIPRRTLERSGIMLIICVFIAGWFGTIQLISWMPSLSREWSGAVGQFLASVLSNFIGTIGSFLVTSVALFITIAIAFDIDIRHTFQLVHLYYARGLDWLQLTWQKIRSYDRKEETPVVEEKPKRQRRTAIAADDEESETDEPARLLRRAITTEISPEERRQQEAKIIRFNEEIVDAASGEILAKRASLNGSANASKNGTASKNGSATTATLEPKSKSKGGGVPLTPNDTINNIAAGGALISDYEDEEEEYEEDIEEVDNLEEEEYEEEEGEALEASADSASTVPSAKLTLNVAEMYHEEEVDEIDQSNIYDEEVDYTPPGMALLEEHPEDTEVNNAELKMNGRILQEKLETFKIKIEDVTITPGPVITQYEFVPAPGVKISQIESLADDIALALKAKGIRIIAPVPGKGTVGVEIPNHKPSLVHFSSIIKSKTFNDNDKLLPIALGKTIIGEVFCADLAKMPHLLIAGSTGSGKSVGINTILMSLMYKMHPRDLKFVIIDPKKVEMTLYSRLKHHFFAMSPDIDETVITTPQNAVLILKSVVAEMEERYDLLASVGQRKITDYNQKVLEGKLTEKDGKILRPLPFIVVVIDELADLMITARNEVEEPIIRLAQLARAVGIHLVVATQRPSVDVITGLIKANFPARIAYQVASKIDSRTVLDMSGAEQLLGNGDMLYTPGGSKPIRLQNSFISTDEVDAITDFIGTQRGYSSAYMLPSLVSKDGGKKDLAGEYDPLFTDAARTIVQFQQGSVSLLQRRLKIGYSRAARIVDELESAGIVGAFDGSKARAVLLESEAELDMHLATLGLD